MLSDLLEAKDRQLLNHCSRVSFYATLLANRTNLTVDEQKSLALGAFLHDIGKIGKEPYRFADDEIVARDRENELRAHPEIGAKMVGPLGLPAAAGQIIAYHHERWDGSGYPHGLKGRRHSDPGENRQPGPSVRPPHRRTPGPHRALDRRRQQVSHRTGGDLFRPRAHRLVHPGRAGMQGVVARDGHCDQSLQPLRRLSHSAFWSSRPQSTPPR